MADFKEDYNMRDIDYGMHGVPLTPEDLGYDTPAENDEETLNEVKENIKSEAQTFEVDIIKDIDDADFLSKKEKNALKRVVSKRINQIIKEYSKESDEAFNGIGCLELDEIGGEVDESLEKVKKSVNEMLDIDEYGYGYGGYQSNVNQYSRNWPKQKYPRAAITTPKKDYSSGIKEIESDRKVKIKIDKETLDAFLSESDGDNENIGIITADNREFTDIEDVIFKIVKIEEDVKKRQGAYTEADGKAISDYAQKHGLVKCGWIHTHPFTRNSTFFSGLDNTTTKEMCVLPDDYCLAVVVGCEYKEVDNYMKDDGKIVKEFDLFYNLGRVTYRKVELKTEKYNKDDTITNESGFVMVKYDCEIVTVDKDGNVVEEI